MKSMEKNNYRGYKSVTEVEVMAADISCGTLIAGDKAYSKKNQQLEGFRYN